MKSHGYSYDQKGSSQTQNWLPSTYGFKVDIKNNTQNKSIHEAYVNLDKMKKDSNHGTNMNSINDQLDSAFREWENINQMILEEKQKQQSQRK